ncbi:hypothetical protein KCP70_09075 [Salmonella enterica subsp. enterica]|nr:hypothetical protein KCP70_09075 [Salmonella enterica subsp. enterica]
MEALRQVVEHQTVFPSAPPQCDKADVASMLNDVPISRCDAAPDWRPKPRSTPDRFAVYAVGCARSAVVMVRAPCAMAHYARRSQRFRLPRQRSCIPNRWRWPASFTPMRCRAVMR